MSTFNNSLAIKAEKLNKIYQLYNSPLQRVMDALDFNVKGVQKYNALKNINLEIKKGEKVGIVGRNGSGKSTLLKVIAGLIEASDGEVKVFGTIQSLMNVGVGYHEELSGYENIKSILLYSNLSLEEHDAAIEEIVDFVELGEFIHQPVRAYSLGMKARLQFAAATALKPDILIIDEVLGAGDAYFASKCAHRLKKLVSSGCTLLLVSHSNQQVLQFCDRAIWLEEGEIVADDSALSVIKQYEKYINSLSQHKQSASESGEFRLPKHFKEKLLESSNVKPLSKSKQNAGAKDEISRWEGVPGPKIRQVSVVDYNDIPIASSIGHGQPFKVKIAIDTDGSADYKFKAVLVLFNEEGTILCRICSEYMHSDFKKELMANLYFRENYFNKGEYVFSVAIYKTLDLDDTSTAEFYDLYSRSHKFVIESGDDDIGIFSLPISWELEKKVKAA